MCRACALVMCRLTDDVAAATDPAACCCPPVVAEATPAAMVAMIPAVAIPMPKFIVLRIALVPSCRFVAPEFVVHEENALCADSGALRER
jgi:hypothetical protein